jgi:hypothetical protein
MFTETRIQSTAAAIMGVLNVIVLLDWVHLTDTQLAAINTAILLVMGAIRVWFEPKVNFIGTTEGEAT